MPDTRPIGRVSSWGGDHFCRVFRCRVPGYYRFTPRMNRTVTVPATQNTTKVIKRKVYPSALEPSRKPSASIHPPNTAASTCGMVSPIFQTPMSRAKVASDGRTSATSAQSTLKYEPYPRPNTAPAIYATVSTLPGTTYGARTNAAPTEAMKAPEMYTIRLRPILSDPQPAMAVLAAAVSVKMMINVVVAACGEGAFATFCM